MIGESAHTASKERSGAAHPSFNYCLKSEVSITLRCQVMLAESRHDQAKKIQMMKYCTVTSSIIQHLPVEVAVPGQKKLIKFNKLFTEVGW